jgi:hypothetical protein
MADYQSASLACVRRPSGVHDQVLILSDNCEFVDMERPLWRKDEAVIPQFLGTHGLILVFQISDFPNMERHDPVFISPRNREVFAPLAPVIQPWVEPNTNYRFSTDLIFLHHTERLDNSLPSAGV